MQKLLSHTDYERVSSPLSFIDKMLGIQQTSSPLLLHVCTLEQPTTCSPHLNALYLRQLTGLDILTYLNHGPEISTHKNYERNEVNVY